MDLFVTSLTEAVKMFGDPVLLLLMVGAFLWGAIAGALPGIGPNLAIGVALPFTFGMDPVYAVAFLVAINCACSFGNSIPAILVGVPGTTSAFLTAIDGYALHKQGKSGLALGVQFYGAVVGQFISLFFFLALVVPLSGLRYVFLAPEMFSLYFLGMTAIVSISDENILKGVAATAFGLALSLVGRDPVSSVTRFAYHVELREGIQVVPVCLGLLAVSELFRSMRQSFTWGELGASFSAKFPPLKSLWRVTPSVLMGTCIGTFVGAIPGLGGTQAAFISYQQSKLWSKHPEEYGHGSIDGVAANEAAQNASQSGEMVPTFGLGVPGSSTMVLLLAALLIHGFVPGPMLIKTAPKLLYASVYGLLSITLIMALLGWPLQFYLLKVVTLDRSLILTGSVALCIVGVFSFNRSIFDVFLMILFGIVGYIMRRYGYSVAGASLALILGDGLETNLRLGLLLCDKNLIRFLTRPWTALFVGISFALLIYGTIGTIKLARRAAAVRRQALAAHLASKAA